jgi:hypothetical protein
LAGGFPTPTSRSTSVLAEPKTPWLSPYREDPQQTRLGQPVFRPFVPVSLAANDASTPELEGLIDTGADAILASDLLADELGLDLTDNDGEELHAVGGRTVVARYKAVSLRLHHHDDSGARCEWEASVGFVDGWHSFGLVLLGNVGFLDHFTVTASRFSQAVAVEARNRFDDRFGVVMAGERNE